MSSFLGWIGQHRRRAGVFAVLAVAGVLGVWMLLHGRGDVPTATVTRGAVIESVYGIGTVTATRSFQLRLGVASAVRGLYVREGDTVRAGQRLLTMDGVTFTAPFDGTVVALPVKLGETVFPQAIVYDLVDLHDRYLVVSLEQQAALRVNRGQSARLSFDSLRGEVFSGEVEALYSRENSFLVRIGVKDLPPQVLPGMTADVAIGIRERPDVLLVPVAAIETDKLYVRRGAGRALPVTVKTGIVDGVMAEIVEGDVHEGDRVLIRTEVAR